MPNWTSWSLSLPEAFGHENVTPEVETLVRESSIRTGIVTIAVAGSTAGVTTIEYEPGALADLERALDALAPTDEHYDHNERWGDGNGFSHLRSALLKTSIAVPVIEGRLQLGTWQQIVVINFDNRPRQREVIAVVVGE